MAIFRIGYPVGSLSRGAINRKLAWPLIRLAPNGMAFPEISLVALPLNNHDLENSSRRFNEHD